MLAARFYQPGDVRVEEVPDPEPGPGDAVIRVRNCSFCGADRKTAQHGHHRLRRSAACTPGWPARGAQPG
jgi:L-iditol 2-dehydrogenase